jgi:lipopolysaccharide export LptBFGC system permease protein LptF
MVHRSPDRRPSLILYVVGSVVLAATVAIVAAVFAGPTVDNFIGAFAAVVATSAAIGLFAALLARRRWRNR